MSSKLSHIPGARIALAIYSEFVNLNASVHGDFSHPFERGTSCHVPDPRTEPRILTEDLHRGAATAVNVFSDSSIPYRSPGTALVVASKLA